MMLVTIQDILGAARLGATALAAETSGYLVLGVAEALRERPRALELDRMCVSETGQVTLTSDAALDPTQAASELLELLASLLSVAPLPSRALLAAASSRARSVEAVASLLEAALMPLNRSAAERVLGRTARLVACLAPSPALAAPSVRAPVHASAHPGLDSPPRRSAPELEPIAAPPARFEAPEFVEPAEELVFEPPPVCARSSPQPLASRARRGRVERSAVQDLLAQFHVTALPSALTSAVGAAPDATAEVTDAVWRAPAARSQAVRAEPRVYLSETPPPAVPDSDVSEPRSETLPLAPRRVIAVAGVAFAVLGAAVLAAERPGPVSASEGLTANDATEWVSPPTAALPSSPALTPLLAPSAAPNATAVCSASVEVVDAPPGVELTLLAVEPLSAFEPRKAVGPLARFAGLPCGVAASLLIARGGDADRWLRVAVPAEAFKAVTAAHHIANVRVPKTAP